MRKKVFAILLTLCMVLTMMPAVAWAAEQEQGDFFDLVFSKEANLSEIDINQAKDKFGRRFDLENDAPPISRYLYKAVYKGNNEEGYTLLRIEPVSGTNIRCTTVDDPQPNDWFDPFSDQTHDIHLATKTENGKTAYIISYTQGKDNSNVEYKLKIWDTDKNKPEGNAASLVATESWTMLFSSSALDLVNKQAINWDDLHNYIELLGEKNSTTTYLYLVKESPNGVVAETIQPVTTEKFDIKYLRGNPDHIDATGVTIEKVGNGEHDNCYKITTDNTVQAEYSTGRGLYDIWPIIENDSRLIYNSVIITSQNQGGEDNQEIRRPVFSEDALLNENGALIEDAPIKNAPVSSVIYIDIPKAENQDVSITKYAYIGTYVNDVLTKLEPINDKNGIKLRYLKDVQNGKPIFAEESEWITAKRLTEGFAAGNDCRYTFTINSSSYNHFTSGKGEYDILPIGYDSLANASLRVRTGLNAGVDQNANYDITLEMLQDPADYVVNGYTGQTDHMWVNGQGNNLIFNSKITEWDTCFFVNNRNTGYDARFEPALGKPEVRTYIGNAGDFVIEACNKSGGDWVKQDTLSNEYQIFSLSYVRNYKGFYNMFNVRYGEGYSIAQVQAAMNTYNYRLRYTGNDPYMRNAQMEDNRFFIDLVYDDNLQEFDIDEYFIDEVGDWATGNYHHFNFAGTKLIMKKIIRPGVLKSVEDKKVYDKEEDYIFIENEAANMKIYRNGFGNEEDFVELSDEDSPFSLVWDAEKKYYVLTYDEPDKDIYGPEYYMNYTGDYDSKINEKYNTTGTHNVGNLCGLITGKLTVWAGAGDVRDDLIDASTDNERINTTEVIFGIDVLNNLNKELKIRTKHGDISFEGDIVENLKKTQSSDVSFEMRDVMKDGYGLTNEQKDALHNCDVAFDFDITSGEAKVEFGENGTAAIVIPFEDETKAVYYLDENGKMYPVEYTFDQGHVKFVAKHFSTYVIADKGLGKPEDKPDSNPGTPGGLPTTPSGDPTQSGATTTTDLSGGTVSKGGETTTTVDQTTADKLVETATKNKSEEIVISAVTKNESAAASTKSAEVTLPAETLGAIAEKTDADVVIKTNVAEVKLDNQAAEAIAQQAQTASGTEGKAETVSIIAEKVKEEAKEVSFELKVVTSSGKVISDFNGGSVSVTVNVPKSLSNKKLVCVYIDENGLKHRVDGQLNADGTYTFTTGHFSTYAIMAEEDAEKAIKDQKEAIKAMKFKLRSQIVKTKSGKKAVKLTWTNPSDIEFEGVAIYRSTKKNTGYGKKSIYVSKSDKYINTAVKSGKKYYFKVRAFVTIDGEKVYTDYSYKAYRTVK